MKLYRVTLYSKMDGHRGFTWHSSYEKADRDAKSYIKIVPGDHKASVSPVEIETNKAGLLKALNKFAGHADNG